ncbi:MAG: reverse transcriptase/maturase family protein [bacterium]|nr:reverse transcriptase/maturase family protein [bacterium]
MRKMRDIYSRIISKENLYHSAYMAAKGRRYRDTTADFNFYLEEEIDRLHKELSAKTYRHGKYRLFTIYEPKERKIAAAPFRDRVVHHAVHDIIEPVIDGTFIYDSYACRKDKGTHKAVNRAQSFLRANAFCFHGDIKKYFPSINHDILKEILKMRIDDSDLLCLLDEIINSALSLRDCFAPKCGARNDSRIGLPIGNLTSQFFANLYLSELDYFIKFDLKARYYLRYMDDFLVFDNDRKALLGIKEKIRDFLKNRLDLDMHKDKSQVYKTRNGIKFLGFRLFKDYRRLTSDNVRRFSKRLKRFAYLSRTFPEDKTVRDEIRDSVRCWVAHSKYADTKTLRLNIWSHLVEKKEVFGNSLKEILLDGVVIGFSERERERESKMRRARIFLNIQLQFKNRNSRDTEDLFFCSKGLL